MAKFVVKFEAWDGTCCKKWEIETFEEAKALADQQGYDYAGPDESVAVYDEDGHHVYTGCQGWTV